MVWPSCIVAKQRNGPIGKIDLVFLHQLTKFENRAEDLGDLPERGIVSLRRKPGRGSLEVALEIRDHVYLRRTP